MESTRDRIIVHANRLAKIVSVQGRRVDEFRRAGAQQIGLIGHGAAERIQEAHRIIEALEQRLEQVNKTFKRGQGADFEELLALLESPVTFTFDAVTALLSQPAIKPIPPDQIEKRLTDLLQGIAIEKRRRGVVG